MGDDQSWWLPHTTSPFWGEFGTCLYHGTSIGDELLVAGETLPPLFMNRLGLLATADSHRQLVDRYGWPPDQWRRRTKPPIVVHVDWRSWWGLEEPPIYPPNSNAILYLRGRMFPRSRAPTSMDIWQLRPPSTVELRLRRRPERRRRHEMYHEFASMPAIEFCANATLFHDTFTVFSDAARQAIEAVTVWAEEPGWFRWEQIEATRS